MVDTLSHEKAVDAKQYNRFAQTYSSIFVDNNQDSISAYFRYLDLNWEGQSVLDLGCGDGYDLFQLKSKGAAIFGIDASEEMVDLAQKKNPDGLIKIGLFDNIPFPDQSFDYVISKWALQTAAFIDPIYKEIMRVLKPDGHLIYLTSHPIRQFLERKRKGKDYFKKEIVESVFFDGQVTAREPSHTLNEYLSPTLFHYFSLEAYEEGYDSGAEKVGGDVYPSYFILKAQRKDYHTSILNPHDYRIAIDVLSRTSQHNALLIDTIRKHVLPQLKEKTRYLDVGSGYAIITKDICQEFAYTTALEPNQELAPIYKDFSGTWHCCSLADYTSSTLYDFVLCSHVLYHLADDVLQTFIDKLLSFTKPGGLCLLALMAPRGQNHELQYAFNPNYVNSKDIIRILDQRGISYTCIQATNHFKGSSFNDMLALCRLFVLDGTFSPKDWEKMSFVQKQEIQGKICQLAKQLATCTEGEFVRTQEEDYIIIYP